MSNTLKQTHDTTGIEVTQRPVGKIDWKARAEVLEEKAKNWDAAVEHTIKVKMGIETPDFECATHALICAWADKLQAERTFERMKANVKKWRKVTRAERDALATELDEARRALTELHRFGPPGEPEKACWCGTRSSHSPGCETARKVMSLPPGDPGREIVEKAERADQLATQNEKLRKMVLWGLGVIPTSNRRWRDAACKLLDALAEAGKLEAGEGETNPSDIKMPDCPGY